MSPANGTFVKHKTKDANAIRHDCCRFGQIHTHIWWEIAFRWSNKNHSLFFIWEGKCCDLFLIPCRSYNSVEDRGCECCIFFASCVRFSSVVVCLKDMLQDSDDKQQSQKCIAPDWAPESKGEAGQDLNRVNRAWWYMSKQRTLLW